MRRHRHVLTALLLASTANSARPQTTSSTPPPSTSSQPALAVGGAAPLSAATLEKIARLPRLFDGTTLAGWIQSPPAPTNFSAGDLTDARGLAKLIAADADAVAGFLRRQFDDAGQRLLT